MAMSEPTKQALSAPLTERITAAIIDLIIAVGLCFFPRVGWMFGLIYHLMRDALPFLKGQSFGKHLLKIKTVALPQNESLTAYPEKSVIRGLVTLIPIVNLIDLWFLFSKGKRLADKWAHTDVIYSEESEK